MKRCLLLLSLVWAGAAGAVEAPKTAETLATPDATIRKEAGGALRPDQINQIRNRRTVYSGSVVQAIKTHNPLQLINPFAPASAGTGEANTVVDPKTGAAAGFKLFCISH
jgi:hypothetical protein